MEVLKNIQVVVFDCDGVLFDTAYANQMYYNQLLQHFGRPPLTPEQLEFANMHTVHEALAYLFEATGTLAAAMRYRETMDYRDFLKYLQMEPQLPAILARLRKRFKTAIATNRSDTMDPLLGNFNLTGSFDLVVTSSDVEYPKPRPDVLLRILSVLGIAAQQAVYIGDSLLDAQAADAADMPFVAFRNDALRAHYHIQNFDELADILEV